MTESVLPDEEERPARHRGRLHRRLHANPALSLTTKLLVTTLGTLVLVGGLVMMVTPGPGIVGIVLGLAILATEYAWAERWLTKARERAHQARLKAEAMDPKVRRRRLLLGGLFLLAVTGAVAFYVVAFDWPRFAIDSWNWLQEVAGWVPDLPGM